MLRRPIKEINAEFLAEEKYLDSVQRIVREACSAASMSRKQTSAVMLAIEEGATNIIRHAYLYETGTLRLRIIIYRKLISFSLIDFGRSFRPRGDGKLDLQRLVESGRRGGLGFYMIQKIMDSVEYISWAGQNELRMTKRLGSKSERAAPFLHRMFTLRAKFSFWTAVIVSLIIGAAFAFVNDQMKTEIYHYLDGTVRALGETIAQQSSLYFINHRSDVEFDELVVGFEQSNEALQRIVLIDSAGFIVAHSDDILNIRKPFQPPAAYRHDAVDQPQRWTSDSVEVNYLVLPIVSGSRHLGAAHLTYNSASINQRLSDSRQTVLKLTALLVLVGIIGIYLLSNHFVKPIVGITNRVRRFTKGDLESELPLVGAAEFFEISTALNEMMTRLRRDQEMAVERERLTKEIEVASEIQKTLLPRELPNLPGMEIEAFYRAASMIGGDLYDVFKVDEDRTCFVVADVAGKGVPASLVMSMLRTVIRIFARGADSSRAVLVSVNDHLSVNFPKGMFITVMMAMYSSERQQLKLVSAGHNPLLVYRAAEGEVVSFNPSGMPLGVPDLPGSEFEKAIEEVEVTLEDGDAFLAYTDGVTEAISRDGEQYGLERLTALLERNWRTESPASLKAVSQELISELDSFSGFASQRDDITFVLCRKLTKTVAPIKETDGVETRSLDISEPDDTSA